jgi:hypothetical protein
MLGVLFLKGSGQGEWLLSGPLQSLGEAWSHFSEEPAQDSAAQDTCQAGASDFSGTAGVEVASESSQDTLGS